MVQNSGEDGIKSRFIGRDGCLITDGYPYDLAKSFSDELAAVFARTDNEVSSDDALRIPNLRERRSAGRWGYIDQEGQVAIPLQFEAAGFFREGRARVMKKGGWLQN